MSVQQLNSYNYLFADAEIFLEGGLFFVEDVEMSYWKAGMQPQPQDQEYGDSSAHVGTGFK